MTLHLKMRLQIQLFFSSDFDEKGGGWGGVGGHDNVINQLVTMPQGMSLLKFS